MFVASRLKFDLSMSRIIVNYCPIL